MPSVIKFFNIKFPGIKYFIVKQENDIISINVEYEDTEEILNSLMESFNNLEIEVKVNNKGEVENE